MASRIKGITIEIGGETVGLQKALADVNKRSNTLKGELKDVERLLKFDPSNVEALAQKQKLVSKQVEVTSDKLERLRKAEKQVQDQVKKGKISEEQYRSFRREIEFTEKSLNSLKGDADKAKRSIKELGQDVARAGDKMQTAGQNIAGSFGAAAVAMGAGLGLAVNKSMEFEAQLSRVGAISDATKDQLDDLRKSALDLGASTSKSASEVALGQEALAALGFTVEDIIGAMPGVISAAEASGSDMAQTAEVMASTLNIFGLEASKANDVADVLAKTANVSAANLTDMQYALKYAGPPAAALGVSLEELSAAIGIMTNAGMKGEQAGTTLRGALLGLLDPSEENSKRMDKMGIAITDAEGNFVGLAQLIDNLKDSMEGQTETQKAATLAALVGKEAVSGMLSLMAAGHDEINKMTKALEDSGGASEEAAGKMKDNLKGTLDELSGSFETMQISIGTALTPALEKLAVMLQGVTEWFNNLSPSTQQFIAISALVITAILGLVATIGIMLTIVGGAITGFTALAGLMPAVGAAFAFLTGPIGLTIAAIAAVIAIGVLLYKNWDTVKEKAKALWDNMGPLQRALEAIGGPIGRVISAGINLIKNWDDVMAKAGKLRDKVVNMFKGIKWELPKLKLPHFKVSGNLDLNPVGGLSFPKVTVDWYKNGGVFAANSPQVIGVGDHPTAQEAVLPLTDSVLGKIANMIGDRMGGGQGIVIQQMVVREEADIEKIAQRLYQLTKGKARGQGVIML
jgi:TP901 family phage tail tape measure protein